MYRVRDTHTTHVSFYTPLLRRDRPAASVTSIRIATGTIVSHNFLDSLQVWLIMLSISVIRTDRSFVRPSGRAGTAQHREPYDANWYWCARKCMHNWYHGLSMLDADLYAASNKLLLRPQFQENQGQRVRYFSRKPITIHINTVTQFIHSLHLYETAAFSFRQTCLLLPRFFQFNSIYMTYVFRLWIYTF